MTEEEAFSMMRSIIADVETLAYSGYYTAEKIVNEIQDELCHLWPEQETKDE